MRIFRRWRNMKRAWGWWRYKPGSGRLRMQIHFCGFVWAGITTLCVYYMAVSGVLLLLSDRRLPRILQTQQADYLSDGRRVSFGLFLLVIAAFALAFPVYGAFAVLLTFGGIGLIDSVYHLNGRAILFWAGFLVIGWVKQRDQLLYTFHGEP